MFCITCASFWFSGFPAIPSGVSRPLLALVYLLHGGPLLPFELLATRLLPSSFIFLYTFSNILLPSPASRRLCTGSSFFSSVLLSFSTSVVPSLGAVTCAWCICTLDISPVPHSLPWLIICGFGFFSSSFTAFSSLVCLLPFSLWLLVLYVCGLSCCSSMVASEFFFTYAPRSHSLYPPFVWGCVPGSGAFLFPPTFLPCRGLSGGSLSVAYPYAVLDLLAGGHAFHFCWLLAHSGEL